MKKDTSTKTAAKNGQCRCISIHSQASRKYRVHAVVASKLKLGAVQRHTLWNVPTKPRLRSTEAFNGVAVNRDDILAGAMFGFRVGRFAMAIPSTR
jgi:hypothetical protein